MFDYAVSMINSEWLASLNMAERTVRIAMQHVEKYATDPKAIPDQKPFIASLRKLASMLSDIERAKVRTPGQVGRPAIHRDDPAERERYRHYLQAGMGTKQIFLTGKEPYSRDTINKKLQHYSEELGIDRITQFGKGRKSAE